MKNVGILELLFHRLYLRKLIKRINRLYFNFIHSFFATENRETKTQLFSIFKSFKDHIFCAWLLIFLGPGKSTRFVCSVLLARRVLQAVVNVVDVAGPRQMDQIGQLPTLTVAAGRGGDK